MNEKIAEYMDLLLEIIAFCSLGTAFVLLILLAAVDLKKSILPNKMVAGFLAAGMVFHTSTGFTVLSPADILAGAIVGAGLLYTIRFFSNRIYRKDTLGLGDVKLMGAGGVWLGPYYILIALVFGALAGVFHGLGLAVYKKIRTGTMPGLGTLSLPAGPGFAIGILVGGFLLYLDVTVFVFL